jgi:hypothetical protein
MTYSKDYSSAIEFAQKMVSELSDVLPPTNEATRLARQESDKRSDEWQLNKGILSFGDIDTSKFNIFKTEFTPRGGRYSISSSLDNYCIGIRGIAHYQACSRSREEYGLIFIYSIKTVSSIDGKYQVELIEAKQGNEQSLLALAKKLGYLTLAEIAEQREREELTQKEIAAQREREELAQKEKERELAALAIAQANARIKAEKEQLSKNTYEQVILRGTKICHIDIASTFSMIPAYTEDFVNGKIKVSYSGNEFWDWPQNWYACDTKP